MSQIILCIDDDLEDLDIFEDAISEMQLPFTCVKVLSGIDGLSYLTSHIPDFIFLDINMPAMNGIEVLKSIRRLRGFANIPVIIFSTTISSRQELTQEGATACISKPGNFHDLCLTLKEFFQ